MKTRNVQLLMVSPEQAFEAWFSPDTMVRLGLKAAEIEPRHGGAFAFNTHDGHLTSGVFTAFAPERAVQTWAVRSPGGELVESLITTEFKPLPDGGTEMSIVEESEALATPEARADGEAGWAAVMTGFADVLETTR